MEIPLNNKKGEEFSTIFSKIDEDEKTQRYSHLQNNLSKLQQSVYLLSFYGTKGQKKMRKKLITSPKTETEPNLKSKASKKMLKTKEFMTDNSTNKTNENKTNKTKHLINEMTKTSFSNKSLKGNIFMTNANYIDKSKNKIISLNNTNYTSNNTYNNAKKVKLPNLKSNSSFTKTNIENNNKNNNSRNKSLSNRKNNSLNKEQFPQITNYMIKNMKKENNNIKNKIYKGIDKFNIMEWYMKTRFKYAQYKYGIAEIQKYFMDLKAYGKPEEEEIEKRKTFYEHVEDIIDDIHLVQQQKETEKINKKYGIAQDKKKLLKSKKENNNNDNPQKKQRTELSKALQEIIKRQKKEKQKRQQIDDILFKCKQRVHSINCFDKKLPNRGRKLTEV